MNRKASTKPATKSATTEGQARKTLHFALLIRAEENDERVES